MTKEEKIKEEWIEAIGEKVYGFNKKFIDENGCMNYYKRIGELDSRFEIVNDIDLDWSDVRPKSLQGIENNNGWTKLKGIKNEITHEGDIWILNKYGNIELWLESQFLAIGYATHYQPIQKPKPPIY